MTSSDDVAATGADLAGATAAREPNTAGHSVALSEARGRVGGRTYTGEGFGHQVEFGDTPTWGFNTDLLARA